MNDESRTIDEALGKLLKGDSANLTPRELELLNELFEQTPESVFIHWAFKYIRRNPGRTAMEIADEYIDQGRYTGRARDLRRALAGTLHYYVRDLGEHVPVYREERFGIPYTFHPLPEVKG